MRSAIEHWFNCFLNLRKINTNLFSCILQGTATTANDLETISVANSSATIANYTLKQYWRKFVQTRKSQANAKKNLFHLIAEEKRKTRTLSKSSLEDGFVITTSNNLLAPNDDTNVIVSRGQNTAGKDVLPNSEQHIQSASSASSRVTSRFLTRIANSLRSLTHTKAASPSATNSPVHTTHHSKLNVKLNENNSSNNALLKIPLLNVFSGPLPPKSEVSEAETELSSHHQIPANLANVFTNNEQSNANTVTSNMTQQTQLDASSDSDEDFEEDIKKVNITNRASNQMSRHVIFDFVYLLIFNTRIS